MINYRLSFIPLLALLTACTHLNEKRANDFESLTQQQQAQYWQAKKVNMLADKLKSYGVSVYVIGDEYQIIIPANLVFVNNSPAYHSPAHDVFQATTNLINAQSTPGIRIEAYANSRQTKDQNYALSSSWAETVQNKLRQAGLAVGVVYTKANGSCDNIGSSSLNNRIEIHYRVSHND